MNSNNIGNSSNAGVGNGMGQSSRGLKIKKDDLKLIQQYCEQNDLGIVDIPVSNNMISNHQFPSHHRTKSEGTTPMGSSFAKQQFQVKQQQQQQQIQMIQQPQYQQQKRQFNPVLDYQKYLEDERVVQYQKSKSSMGYYSQGNTPNNNTGRIIPQSKTPEIYNYQTANYKTRKIQSQMPTPNANKQIMNQNFLTNNPIIQNIMGMQSRAVVTTSQGQRMTSRKKPQSISGTQKYGVSQSINPTLNYNASNPSTIQSMYMSKNPSTNSYKLKPQNSLYKNDQFSLEAHSQDQLNESSVYLYDDPLLKSSHQINLQNNKNKGSILQYGGQLQDESYYDATLYDQFMQGPHNISQYSSSKPEEQNSYIQFNHHRSVSQNQNPQLNSQQMIRQSPSQKNYTRTHIQHNTQNASQVPQKGRRTTNQTMQNSLNISSQKQNQQQFDRRMIMGRTPSPNFLKKISGMMHYPHESLIVKQHMYQNNHNNTTKNLLASGHSSRRSNSKQQFSTNQAVTNNTTRLIGTQQIAIQMNRSQKQKFARQQYGTALQQNRYKSGSITTSANTAQNSPKNRGITPKRGNSKQKTIQQVNSTTNQNQFYQMPMDFDQTNDQAKKQAFLGQVAISHQNKLRKVNKDEEMKALAMISSIGDQIQSKQQLSQQHNSQSIIQAQQFYQPSKMIGEIMEEEPQPLSSHEFLNMEEIRSIQKEAMNSQKVSRIKKQNTQSQKSEFSPGARYYDGGTGSNNINQIPNTLMMSKNSALSNETQTYSQNLNQINPQTDNNQITQYLEQLQNLRQSQQLQMSQSTIKSPSQLQQKGKNQSQATLKQSKIQSSIASLNNQISMQNYQSNQQPVRQKTDNSLIKMIDEDDSLENNSMSIKNKNNYSSQAQSQTSKHDTQKRKLSMNSNQYAQMQNQNIQNQIQYVQEPNFKSIEAVKVQSQKQPSIQHQSSIPSQNQSQYTNSQYNSNVNVNYGATDQSLNRKKTQSVEPPKITPPNVDMFKNQMNEVEEKLKEHTNFNKNKQSINFTEKTPFEKELEMKAQEMKNVNNLKNSQQMLIQQNKNSVQSIRKDSADRVSGMTQEQIKLQKYKEDSISILKQLQESGNITESLIEAKQNTAKNNIIEFKKQSTQKVTQAKVYQQVPDEIVTPSSHNQSNFTKKKASVLSSDISKLQNNFISEEKQEAMIEEFKNKNSFIENDNRFYREEEEEDKDVIMITQEDERQIKDIVSDIDYKAFYGKVMKKTKNAETDDDFKHLSPRSREIATVMKVISKSFKDADEPPITTTDFYRIGKMLGRGAFGKVNLAMHKLVRKLVAIKSLNKECLTDEIQKQKLMKEVALLLKLRHNHVVKIYETIETEKHIIIVMELCAGGDLLNYVRKRRKLKEPYAKFIFKQIIDGLCYIHSKYIAHRDIKLDNILLDGKGNVKIADFGISKKGTKGQKMTEQCGTPAYIAPEILKDKGYSFNIDIWSAGVVLFAMLYGTVPFKANNMEELHKLILKGKYTLKDDISIEARNLLRGLLEVNPEKRLTIQQIYRHKWLSDVDPNLELFNDQEKGMIKKEYTYNDPRRYNRNENEEPVDCFTEHHLESVYNSLKNATSKSIILAPFNSTQSQIDPMDQAEIQKLLCEKMMILNLARRCREIDRQYEFNNNGDLDNGVYHKYVYNSEDGDNDSDNPENPDKLDGNSDLLSVPMLISERNEKRKGGRASVENSFENNSSIQQMQDRQALAKKIKENSNIQKDFRNKRGSVIGSDLDNIDKDLVQTFETFQSKYSSKNDEEKVKQMVEFGYPHDYVLKSLEESDPNYCTAGYYLLCMDQNYC